MPSNTHEALIQMFRHRPVLAAELLATAFGVELPAFERVQLGSGELTPIEHRADAVVELRDGKRITLAVVVEVQLRRDPVKRYSWPVYLATVRARSRCPAALLVVCADSATAAWCAQPIALGPGNAFTPIVLGPAQVPALTDPDDAAINPELAVLSAIAHANQRDREEVLFVLPAALAALDDDHFKLYHDLVMSVLPNAARHYLEELVRTTYQYQSDFARRYVAEGREEGRAEGRAEGEAGAILTVLGTRGVAVPASARERITSCTDHDQLSRWLRLAVTATSIEEVLG